MDSLVQVIRGLEMVDPFVIEASSWLVTRGDELNRRMQGKILRKGLAALLRHSFLWSWNK